MSSASSARHSARCEQKKSLDSKLPTFSLNEKERQTSTMPVTAVCLRNTNGSHCFIPVYPKPIRVCGPGATAAPSRCAQGVQSLVCSFYFDSFVFLAQSQNQFADRA